MKKVLALVLSLLVASSAYADACGTSVIGPFTAAQSVKLCSKFLPVSTVDNPFTITVAGDAQRLFKFGASSDTAFSMKWGDAGTTAAQVFALSGSTSDADDDSILQLTGGGAYVADGTRGASLNLPGAEASNPDVLLVSGSTAGTDIYIQNQNTSNGTIQFYTGGAQAWVIEQTGKITGQAGSGDIVFSKSGTGLAIDTGTAASACMGVATPNGTTPVAVSTTCAASNSRVFFTRVGAVANMASISTTTAPSGTGFSFASTGASDTLASSVVWMIIKEG